MEKVRAHVFIEGRVQGVFYRAWVRDTAFGLGLTGWVRNLTDGRVEAVAEGEKEKLIELIKLIKQGPRVAQVEHVDVSWEKASGEFEGFEILQTV